MFFHFLIYKGTKMLGGEHQKERISERLQHLNNQPRKRGYIEGCHLRCTGTEGNASFSVKTLHGNWSEERRDCAYYDDHPVLGTEQEKTWQTTYKVMTNEGLQGRVEVSAPSQVKSQTSLVTIVDGRNRCFPGHQPEADPSYTDTVNNAFATTTRSSFDDPKNVRSNKADYVPPVLGGTPDAQARAVLLRLRHKLRQNNGTYAGLRRALQGADTGHDGQLNGRELQDGLGGYGIPMSPAEVKVLMKFFDKDGKGEVPIAAFVRGIRGTMSERRESLVKRAYKLLDANGDGVVRMDDIKRLYDVSHHPGVVAGTITADEALRKFLHEWDANGDDVIEEAEFLDAYSDISAEIDNDQVFELMMRNTWHISGGEGLCKNTSCRRVLVIHTNGRQTVEEIKNDLGIGAHDTEKMLANLAAQGITDVQRMELK